MKILYGVQGTGNGHITRARAMAVELKNQGVDVDFLFSGRPADKFFDMAVFGDYRVLEGLTFATQKGRIQPGKTLLRSRPQSLLRDIYSLPLDHYDLVITDFEPITAWAGRLRKKTVIGLGHQYAFHFPIPQHRGSLSQALILKHFAPASISLGLHWHHFDQQVLPPIAPVEKRPCESLRRTYVVYLPFEAPEEIRRLLAPFDDYQFKIYHPEISRRDEGHLAWHPPGRQTFQNDLQRCEGVVCNAGFELASEVLQLGKKLLVKPVLGQSEQNSNALALDLLGYGHVMYILDDRKLASWLKSTCTTRIHYPNVAGAICQWLLAGNYRDKSQLVSSLWQQTQFPDMTAATRTDHQLGGGGNPFNNEGGANFSACPP